LATPRPRQAALIIAIVSALTIWVSWGAIDPRPAIEDETSYVLQSRIFASGRWTAPSPPIPEFFQQAHVITTPAVASKFFPGSALLMSIGSFFGAPVLVPLLVAAFSGALLFLLVCRIANVWVAVLAIVLWLGDPLNLRFRAGYFSEPITGVMWLIAWWSLLEWRQGRQRRWLIALAAAMAWGAITRPLTMLAFAVPIGLVVLRDVVRDVVRTRAWRDLSIAAGAGIVILMIVPLWSARTTGSWKLTPQTLYTRQYLPFDKPGFGVDHTPPALALSPVNQFTYDGFVVEHERHTVGNLPRIAWERLSAIARQEFAGRAILIPFLLIGLVGMSGDVMFALVCAAALFAGYLSYGHWKEWTLYYFEALPVLSVIIALGVWTSINMLAPKSRRTASAAVSFALLMLAIPAVLHARREHIGDRRYESAFREALARLPVSSAVVFVHYRPGQHAHANLVANSPHLDSDPIWIVNDLGERDRELMRFAGARTPVAFYEATGDFEVDRTLLRAP
jgi:hypothetical protein